MSKKSLNIIVLEPSSIVYEGLVNILMKSDYNMVTSQIEELNDVPKYVSTHKVNIVIVNPSFVQNKESHFKGLKRSLPEVLWVACYYSLFSTELMSLFPKSFALADDTSSIVEKVCDVSVSEKVPMSHELSSREVDVLRHLALGHSNKEIAEMLFISIHTVITHRKNISEKTGIKSIAGLAIYAVSKNLVQA